MDPTGSLEPGVWPLLALDLAGVFVFALSGALAAVRQRFDVFGVLVLAVTAGLGGGALRDVLLGAVPPVGISDWRLVGTAAGAGLAVFVWHPKVSRIRRLVLVLDAVGLGTFVVAGTLKALQLGATPLAAVLVGALTGVGGGVVRDLLSGQVPEILQRSELYATPALLGAVAFTAAWEAGVVHPAVTVAVVLGTVVVRLVAVRTRVRLPQPPGT